MSKLIEDEASTFEEASKHPEWKSAMNEEYQSIMKNGVWEIVPRLENKSVVTSKWIYKIKHAVDGSIDKYKGKFVARGFSQEEGIDYEEAFAPTTRYTTIQSLISLAVSMKWKVHQMDVKTAFLNGTIDEEVYIEQPLGFEVNGKEGFVCRLEKALYGLKQAPRAWYARMDAYLQRLGFIKSSTDPNLYIKVVKDELVIILLYVDDLLLTGVEERIQECKKQLTTEFDMKDLGSMHYYLGLEVWQEPNGIYLGQGKYVIEILKRFDMMECKPMTNPMITNLRLLETLNLVWWIPQAKHILRYLRGTIHHCLKYEKGKDVLLTGFTDSEWGGSKKDGRSTTGGCFSLGSSMVSLMSRKQETVALSSAESEYVAACEVSREAVWLRKLLFDLFAGPLAPTPIHCDNTSYIRLSEDPLFHGKTKHINNKYHYIRKLVQDIVLKPEYVPIDE
eukprot:PITA_11168